MTESTLSYPTTSPKYEKLTFQHVDVFQFPAFFQKNRGHPNPAMQILDAVLFSVSDNSFSKKSEDPLIFCNLVAHSSQYTVSITSLGGPDHIQVVI